MIEVFKTNVSDPDHAIKLVDQIHQLFRDYKANFDLEDCDNILRVAGPDNDLDVSTLINILETYGCIAQVLPD